MTTPATPTVREQLVISPAADHEPTIARWVGALQDARQRTFECLDDLAERALDFERDGENTIGTLLYHIAAIEADWLYVEVLEQDFPTDIIALFPHDVRTEDGRLTPVHGLTLDQHLARLARVRQHLLSAFADMPLTDFQRARALPRYDVTPEWVLHHLMQHEAEHRGQIGLLRAAAKQSAT